MAAHRRLDRRRDGLCAGGLRKRAWNAVCSFSILQPPKRIGLRSNIRLSGVLVKNVLDYVSRRFNAYSAGLKSRLGSLTFAEAPLSAISRFNWSPESAEVRPLLKAPCEDGSWFGADLEQSTSNKKAFMKFVSFTKPIAMSHQIHTSFTELQQQIH